MLTLNKETNVVTAHGEVVSQTIDKAGKRWVTIQGEMTNYQYTGQHSYANDFGLMLQELNKQGPPLGCPFTIA